MSTTPTPLRESRLAPLGTEGQADENPALVYLARLLSPQSRRSQASALKRLAAMLCGQPVDPRLVPWAEVRYQHSQALRAMLAEQYAPSTANRHLAALRGVLEEAWRLGQMDAEAYQRARDVKCVDAERLPAGREVDRGELRALFEAAANGSALGARNAALLAVLYGAGLRRSEAVGLDLADFDAETGELRIRWGKGRKERIVYASNGSRDALLAWLSFRGDEAGPLLCPVLRGGHVRLRRMSGQAVLDALSALAEAASVRSFRPHDLRRTFVSHLLAAGADISTVQKMAGHAHVQTTARYDRRGEEAKRAAAELLHVPFVTASASH